ncbi:MAG: pyridoxal-phosphate dependent enzyme [Archangiaceae bacterium]|nr:pyridoxal-phosphate dependent enzyme [Archangiaceae bacterium]
MEPDDVRRLSAALDALPTLGWVRTPSPVIRLPGLQAATRAAWLGAKRDDLLPALHGGTKVRKLDALLAAPPFDEALALASFGALGSGHLATASAAARELALPFDAYVFLQRPTSSALDNLALTAASARRITCYRQRLTLGLAHPRALAGGNLGGATTIPPGGTSPGGMVGLVRAAVELEQQIREGLLPCPDHIYVALGTGGIAAGLAVGLGLAGVDTAIVAVATVEPLLSRRARLDRLIRSLRRLLQQHGVPFVAERPPVPIELERDHLGGGYGVETPEALQACALGRSSGLPLEPTYTGKALAALRARRVAGQRVLFWQSAHRDVPRPDGWEHALPPELRAFLQVPTRPGLSRRRVLLAGAGAAVGALAWQRSTGYPEGWRTAVLAAAAEVLIPPGAPGPTPREIAANVERYVATMSPKAQREVRLLLVAVEQGTSLLGGCASRFTRLSTADREAFLTSLSARGGPLALLYRGLRDLCLLGYWQEPRTWPALAYGGPTVDAGTPPAAVPHPLRAPAGAVPRGALP